MESVPCIDASSRGSSVSTTFQEEYEELLRYAIVLPNTGVPRNTAKPERLIDIHGQGDASAKRAERLTGACPKRECNANVLTSTDSDSSRPSSQLDTRRGESIVKVRIPEGGQPLRCLETRLDEFCTELRRCVLQEAGQLRASAEREAAARISCERDRFLREQAAIKAELDAIKELLSVHESTLDRKDGVIAQLMRALQKDKEKGELLRGWLQWRMLLVHRRGLRVAERAALKHRDHVLLRKGLAALKGAVREKWRQRVERACQARAQEICRQLNSDWEARLRSSEEALCLARKEAERLRHERELFEEQMKKAFMRGVCALNLEAMSMFHEGPPPSSTDSLSGSREHLVSSTLPTVECHKGALGCVQPTCHSAVTE